MAAATSVFLALDRPTHIVASQVQYWGFREWLAEVGRYGHAITFVDTSDLSAVAAAVRPGETGILVEPADPPAQMANALLGLVDSPVLRREMAEAARAYALTQTWAAIMGRLRERYLAVAEKGAAVAVS